MTSEWIVGNPYLTGLRKGCNTSDNQELASRLRKAGDARVTELHMHTDHTFSDHRIAMQAAIVNWLAAVAKLRP
jgi:hypothetical protein